jgi:hypothetical protein
MHFFRIIGLLIFLMLAIKTQAQTLIIKAFERNSISGVAPTPIISIGGKESAEPTNNKNISYLIYLIASNYLQVSIEQVWINQTSFSAKLSKIKTNSIIIKNSADSTNISATKNTSLWQLQVLGKATKIENQQKMQALINKNNLVVLLKDTKGRRYTRVIPQIIELEPERLQ